MQTMFYNCKNLTTLDLRNFDTSKVTTMYSMFAYTQNLKPIYVGENWKINEDANVSGMFSGSKTTSVEELCEPGSTEEWCVVN